MTDRGPLRKVIFLCAALASASGLSACNDPDLAKTFADIKAIKVDDEGSGTADDRKLRKDDVELAVNTARDLTFNDGGLFRNDTSGGAPKFEITVVDDPLKMPPPAEAPLDERIAGAPSTPPSTVVDLPLPQPETRAEAVHAVPAAGRYIQVGSFGTASAAKSAWTGLLARYPGIDRYSPAFQPVTTASGKTLVRLKVGPVADERQAASLCAQIDIRDAWCARAS